MYILAGNINTLATCRCVAAQGSYSKPQNPQFTDAETLRQTIVTLRSEGRSCRQIAREVGLHWTRVGQIVKGKK